MSDELPSGWVRTTLGELCDYISSGSRDWSKYYSDHGALFVRTQDINQNRLAPIADIARVALPKRVEGKRTLIQQGDLLITITGANVGKCAFVPSLLPEAYVSQSVALTRLKKELCGQFIQQQLITLNAETGRTLLQDSAYGVGRPVLNLDNVRETPIRLAPLPEQERLSEKVASLLAKVDTSRGRLRNIHQILKRFHQSVLAAACSGRLTADWREENSANSSNGTEDLPVGWFLSSVGEVLQGLKYGTSMKCGYERRGVPVLRIPNVVSGKIDQTDLKFAELPGKELKQLRLMAGDILLIRSNGSVSLVGRTAIVSEEQIDFAYAGYLIRLRPNRLKVQPDFLNLVLASFDVRVQIELEARSTSGVNNINTEEVQALRFLLPPLSEQQEIVRRVEKLSVLANRIEARFVQGQKQVDSITQSILAKAFRGELVPTESELSKAEGRSFESAEELLNRLGRNGSAEGSDKETKLHPPVVKYRRHRQ